MVSAKAEKYAVFNVVKSVKNLINMVLLRKKSIKNRYKNRSKSDF